MIVWIEGKGRLSYVIATFADQRSADAYIALLPASIREGAIMRARENLDYPCVLIEDHRGFHAMGDEEAIEYFRHAFDGREPDEDGAFGILYILDEPFQPSEAGSDQMGAIDHIHLDAEALQYMIETGSIRG